MTVAVLSIPTVLVAASSRILTVAHPLSVAASQYIFRLSNWDEGSNIIAYQPLSFGPYKPLLSSTDRINPYQPWAPIIHD